MLLFTELQVNHIHFETAFYSFVRKKYFDFYRTTVINSAIEHTQAIGERCARKRFPVRSPRQWKDDMT